MEFFVTFCYITKKRAAVDFLKDGWIVVQQQEGEVFF